jgi:hypothetical protein
MLQWATPKKPQALRMPQQATMKKATGSTGGVRDMVSHVALTQDLTKTMLQAMEITPSQDQVCIPNGSKGLAPVGEWGPQWGKCTWPTGCGELPDITVEESTTVEIA